MQPPDRETLAEWRRHLQDEADAAFLYLQLADHEPAEERRALFRRLAAVEQRHVDVWRKVFRDRGVSVDPPGPTLRARVLAGVARRFGSGLLLALLLREEGAEVRGYLALHRRSAPGGPKDAALELARESAQHAETLRGLTAATGEPWHRTRSGGLLRNVVYGFNDGLTANFGLVAGVIGADVAPHVILVTGAAGALADALSMGSSGYLAAKSEQEVYAHEIAMEREEIRLMPEVEQEELALIYEAKGLGREQAERVAREIMSSPEGALEEKVREELGIGEPYTTPLREGWITGTATLVGAALPVLPFFVLEGKPAVWGSFLIAMGFHFGVGAARSVFTGRGIWRSGADMFVVGLGVAAAGYLAGGLLVRWLL